MGMLESVRKPPFSASARGAARQEVFEDRLFDRDWRFIVEAIHRLNAIDDLEQFQRETLESLMVLIPCDQGTFFLYEETEDALLKLQGTAVVVGAPALYIDDFENGDFADDPYFRGMDDLGSRLRVFRDSEILPEEYRMRTRLYQEIYSKQGIHYALRAFSVSNGQTVGNISLFNSRESGEFTPKDKEILTIMEPHITLKLNGLCCRASAEKAEHNAADANTALDALVLSKLEALHLTNREIEILRLILRGISDREVADQLFISFSTFKKHLYNIYRKLDVNNRIQLYHCVRAMRE